MFCAISISAASSRSTWAFARDKALPFHSYFSKVSPRFGPLNAFLLLTLVQLLLGLIYLGSTAAFNAFVGVAVMCLQASNSMPIFISLLDSRKSIESGAEGFSLKGPWGWILNILAVTWTLFQIVLFSMPAVRPVTKTSMSASLSS